MGLAGGLKNTFFDGLEVVVLDWFVQEGGHNQTPHILIAAKTVRENHSAITTSRYVDVISL